MKYSILMYNFNNYEIMREPDELDPECEYVYVTDNTELMSTKWRIVVDKSLNGLSPFEKCYRVRFNLFKYVSTPVCIYIDGSIQIHKSLRILYEAFTQSGADLGLNVHLHRSNMNEEYDAWITGRNYPRFQKDKCYAMFNAAHYDPQYNGLYQGTVRICKNTKLNKQIDTFTFNTLIKLGTNGIIERLDQTIYSFIINKFFPSIKIFPFSQQVFQSDYMTWMIHNTTLPIQCKTGKYLAYGYVFNHLQPLYLLH